MIREGVAGVPFRIGRLIRRAKHWQNGIIDMNLDRARGGTAGFFVG